MSMSRADSASYLAGTLAQLLADAGLAATDTAGGLKEPIDDALLATGTDYADLASATVANTDVVGFRLVLDYTGILRCYRAIAHRVDIQLDGPQVAKSRSQAVRQLEKLVDDARKAADPHMSASNSDWGFGSIDLDFIEPVES